jgi:hypothetical protein
MDTAGGILTPAELSRHPRAALRPLSLGDRHEAGSRLAPLDTTRYGTPSLRPGGSLDQLAAPGRPKRPELEEQARILVSTTFFGTILKQMRESPFRSELWSGGRGGQAFGALYDQQIAERMARGAGQKLVRAIVRSFEARGAYAKQDRATGPRTGSDNDLRRYAIAA